MKNISGYLLTLSLLATTKVQAAIPASDDFVDGLDNSKGGLDAIYYLIEKSVQVLILGVAIFFAIQIAKGASSKYEEITNGRGGWMDLGGHVIGGVVLLALTILIVSWVGDWSTGNTVSGTVTP